MNAMFICFISSRGDDVNSQKLIDLIQRAKLSEFFQFQSVEQLAKNLPKYVKAVPTIVDSDGSNIYVGGQCFQLVDGLWKKMTRSINIQENGGINNNNTNNGGPGSGGMNNSQQAPQLSPYSGNGGSGVEFSSFNDAYAFRINTPSGDQVKK